MQTLRAIFAIVAWAFLGLVVVQVFLAGIGLFGAGSISLHREFGYLVSLVPLALLIAAALARAGARLTGLVAVLTVITFVQTSLPYFRDDVPYIAALHPVNALAIAWIGLVVALRATALARAPRPSMAASAPIAGRATQT
jgi:mercuric ion transport protein